MTQETLSRAVEPFFSTKEVGRGTGLGLSMVHGLTAQLGGGFGLSSEFGRGTRVDLYLPVAEDASLGERPPMRARSSMASRPQSPHALARTNMRLARRSSSGTPVVRYTRRCPGAGV
jgi:hypothetical protein